MAEELRNHMRENDSAQEVGLVDEYDDVQQRKMKELQVEDELKRIAPWQKQITIRGMVVATLLGFVYSVIVQKLNVTTGLIPNMNVSVALLAFIFIKSWTKFLEKVGIVSTPFTKQENTVVQTCAVACYSIAVAGGFGSFLIALNRKTYDLTGGAETKGNSPTSIIEPELGWMTGFLFLTCFVGLFALIPLRKIMILDLKLTYPSGMATAVLINGFHTAKGDKDAKKQIKGFLKYFSASFLWSFFQWFYAGGNSCGFSAFPTLGLKAWKNSFYFDFSMTYVGAGMICSHLVNLSLLFGAVVSYGIMWPLIAGLKGDWYSATLPKGSMQGLDGYKVFLTIALILGDGIYIFAKILFCTLKSVHMKVKNKDLEPNDEKDLQIDELQRNEVFKRGRIPLWIAVVGYIIFSIVSIIAIPIMFPQVQWYYIVVAYLLAPLLSFGNAYGAGLTDINMAYNYGKIALFVMSAIAGENNGVVAGLIGCGLIKFIVDVSADLMQDLKTGHLTLTSPRSMIVSQAIGTAIGCVIGPLTFFIFYKAFDIGNPDGPYKVPFAIVYRNMAILGVQGFSSLPLHCLELSYGLFAFAIAVNLVRDFAPKKIGRFMPIPTAMSVPFLVGGYFAIDMCIGSLVVFAWSKLKPKEAAMMIPVAASGLICGDGIWVIPSAMLSLLSVKPPICMSFSKSM